MAFTSFFILFAFSPFPTMNIFDNYNAGESKHYYFKKMMWGAAPHFYRKQQLLRNIKFLAPSIHPSIQIALPSQLGR